MKTRVQIRANFECEHPGCEYSLDENNHLNVHHTYYESGLKPWEYPIESLQCLCERHHEEVHQNDGLTSAVDLDDAETREKIIVEAVDEGDLESARGKASETKHFGEPRTPYSGWVKWMWPNGKVQSLFQLKNGKRGGLFTSWYPNGQKEGEGICKAGKIWTLVVWKPNGEKCPVTNIVNGNGIRVNYDEDGTVVDRDFYKDGKWVFD